MASALVALGGIPALWLAADWAGWFTATLFVLLIASPLALLDRARLAAQRGQWKRAARFHWWAYLLHPTPWTRFGLILRRALSDDRPGAYLAALTQIEATGSRNQKALSRLMRAQEQRDWEGLLMLSRTGEVGLSEAKPHEIRALGELGRPTRWCKSTRTPQNGCISTAERSACCSCLRLRGALSVCSNW